jgi:hypothetical protein
MVDLIERSFGEVMRDEMVVRDEIAAFVADEPKTIAEIARHLGHPKHEVMIWVMAMWKYGILRVTGEPDEDGYYLYELNV